MENGQTGLYGFWEIYKKNIHTGKKTLHWKGHNILTNLYRNNMLSVLCGNNLDGRISVFAFGVGRTPAQPTDRGLEEWRYRQQPTILPERFENYVKTSVVIPTGEISNLPFINEVGVYANNAGLTPSSNDLLMSRVVIPRLYRTENEELIFVRYDYININI